MNEWTSHEIKSRLHLHVIYTIQMTRRNIDFFPAQYETVAMKAQISFELNDKKDRKQIDLLVIRPR